MSHPPASMPPGWQLPYETKVTVEFARRVQGHLSSPKEYDTRKEKDENKKGVRHTERTFRDGHQVLRHSEGKNKGGRFAKEAVPRDNRPKRIPWDKKEKPTASSS